LTGAFFAALFYCTIVAQLGELVHPQFCVVSVGQHRSQGKPTERVGLLGRGLSLHDVLAKYPGDLAGVLDLLGRLIAVARQRAPALEAFAGFLLGRQEGSRVACEGQRGFEMGLDRPLNAIAVDLRTARYAERAIRRLRADGEGVEDCKVLDGLLAY
jgi:hypothetical protein